MWQQVVKGAMAVEHGLLLTGCRGAEADTSFIVLMCWRALKVPLVESLCGMQEGWSGQKGEAGITASPFCRDTGNCACIQVLWSGCNALALVTEPVHIVQGSVAGLLRSSHS